MFLTFIGAAGTVTGSKTLVEAGDGSFLVDCGMFQGPREVRERNWEEFPRDPRSLSSIVLTHAHLDHCGYLPRLVRDGFDGPVFCSPNTAELVPIILRDSAKLQEEDTAWARKKGYSRHADPEPLYGIEDALRAIAQLQPVEFGTDFSPVAGVTAQFDPGGHILGSSIVTVIENATGRTVVFSGDLGRGNHPLLTAPAPPPECDAVVVESTYGDREHEDVEEEIDEMAAAITRTLKRGGSVVIPAFAVDRTEVLLYHLRMLHDAGHLPDVPVFVDSPMALAALRIYREAFEQRADDVRPELHDAGELFDLPTLDEVFDSEASKAVSRHGGPAIIIAGAGMATGGRVVHHLKQFLPDPRNSVALVGFQSIGTRGRQLLDGATSVKIHGQYVRVKAEVCDLTGFSVHADASELLDWVGSATGDPTVFVFHGENDAAEALRLNIERRHDFAAVVPDYAERITLTPR